MVGSQRKDHHVREHMDYSDFTTIKKGWEQKSCEKLSSVSFYLLCPRSFWPDWVRYQEGGRGGWSKYRLDTWPPFCAVIKYGGRITYSCYTRHKGVIIKLWKMNSIFCAQLLTEEKPFCLERKKMVHIWILQIAKLISVSCGSLVKIFLKYFPIFEHSCRKAPDLNWVVAKHLAWINIEKAKPSLLQRWIRKVSPLQQTTQICH